MSAAWAILWLFALLSTTTGDIEAQETTREDDRVRKWKLELLDERIEDLKRDIANKEPRMSRFSELRELKELRRKLATGEVGSDVDIWGDSRGEAADALDLAIASLNSPLDIWDNPDGEIDSAAWRAAWGTEVDPLDFLTNPGERGDGPESGETIAPLLVETPTGEVVEVVPEVTFDLPGLVCPPEDGDGSDRRVGPEGLVYAPDSRESENLERIEAELAATREELEFVDAALAELGHPHTHDLRRRALSAQPSLKRKGEEIRSVLNAALNGIRRFYQNHHPETAGRRYPARPSSTEFQPGRFRYFDREASGYVLVTFEEVLVDMRGANRPDDAEEIEALFDRYETFKAEYDAMILAARERDPYFNLLDRRDELRKKRRELETARATAREIPTPNDRPCIPAGDLPGREFAE